MLSAPPAQKGIQSSFPQSVAESPNTADPVFMDSDGNPLGAGTSSGSPWPVALGTAGALLADDVTGVGVLDDPVIFIVASAAVYAESKARVFLTYVLTHPTTGQVYVGRTSGYGTPQGIAMRRYLRHHRRKEGFGPPSVDVAIMGYRGYPAIRGREQQMIDHFGGIGHTIVANRIRGVAKANLLGMYYHNESNFMFGNLHKYTGF
jgi:hypothetical protein